MKTTKHPSDGRSPNSHSESFQTARRLELHEFKLDGKVNRRYKINETCAVLTANNTLKIRLRYNQSIGYITRSLRSKWKYKYISFYKGEAGVTLATLGSWIRQAIGRGWRERQRKKRGSDIYK